MAKKSMLRIEAVFIYFAPPSPKPSHVVAESGNASGDLGDGFSSSCRLEEIIHPFNFWILFPFFNSNSGNYFYKLLSKKEFDALVFTYPLSHLHIWALSHERKFWGCGFYHWLCSENLSAYNFKFSWMYLLIFIVTHLDWIWICDHPRTFLWGHFKKGLTEEGRPILNVGNSWPEWEGERKSAGLFLLFAS